MADITTFPIQTEVLDPANYPEFIGPTGATGADGATGDTGPQGPAGADGTDGVGVPVGGTTGQVLAKASADDYDTEWVDQSGGGGSPGGSDTQVQFNDGGVFGGDDGLTFNKTTDALTAKQFTPATGTITTSLPAIDATQTWNASGTTFTGVKFNATDTASAAGSLLMDLQVGGVSRFTVGKNTTEITAGSASSQALILKSAPSATTRHLELRNSSNTVVGSWGTVNNSDYYLNAGYQVVANTAAFGSHFSFNGTNLTLTGGISSLNWTTGVNASQSIDLSIHRDAAQTLAQRNGTNAQTFRLYGTFTDASNSRRLALNMTTGGVASIKPEGLGTGATGNVLHISGLPDSNPGPGILWNDGGTVKVGT